MALKRLVTALDGEFHDQGKMITMKATPGGNSSCSEGRNTGPFRRLELGGMCPVRETLRDG